MLYNYRIMKKILVVGSKNTYRSIIVAEFLKKALKDKGNNGVEVKSAGIMAFPDIPAEPEAVSQLKSLGIDGEFKSSPLQKQSVAEADLILTMSDKIKTAISGKFSDKAAVIHAFKSYAGGSGDLEASAGLGDEVKGLVEGSIDKFAG